MDRKRLIDEILMLLPVLGPGDVQVLVALGRG